MNDSEAVEIWYTDRMHVLIHLHQLEGLGSDVSSSSEVWSGSEIECSAILAKQVWHLMPIHMADIGYSLHKHAFTAAICVCVCDSVCVCESYMLLTPYFLTSLVGY